MDTQKSPPVMDEKRAALLKLSQEINARIGIFPGPPVDMGELRASQRAHLEAMGINPDTFSSTPEIMRMRYGEDWEAELAQEEERWAREDAAQEA